MSWWLNLGLRKLEVARSQGPGGPRLWNYAEAEQRHGSLVPRSGVRGQTKVSRDVGFDPDGIQAVNSMEEYKM